jgi:CRP/FNR family transcriptional regulator, cyclic AMP receptor protein
MASLDVIPAPLLDAIAAKGRRRQFAANAILVNEGDASSSLYIVLSGRLKVFATSDEGRDVVLADVGPGDYFGEISLDGGQRSASVMALEPATCVVVPGEELRGFLAEHPDFAQHLVLRLIGTVRRLTEQVKSLALQDVYGRLTRLLTEHSDVVGEERIVRTALTQQDIADRIGSSREMVNRVMKQLTVGGYVEVREGRLVVKRRLPSTW